MKTTAPIQRIALTSGEPAGIGPDLCVQLAQNEQSCELVIIADPDRLMQCAKQLNLPLTLVPFDPSKKPQIQNAGSLKVLAVSQKQATESGQLSATNSAYVVETIRIATQGCLNQLFDAMVTAPVHKGIINDAGIPFSGHTEFIADITGGHPVMMLATPGLRVALATTHLPLSEVSQSITAKTLGQVITCLDTDLRRHFSIKNTSILVCGLNPHAGENGYLGREEIDIIEPTVDRLKKQGINLQGPLPADTLFTPPFLQKADAILAMYHDQGLPVLKHMGFGHSVNITLGLPIIRTSVDHGTALDLAGTGQAKLGSLRYAIETAIKMAE